MTREEISRLTLQERERLLDKYCSSLPTDKAITVEQISDFAEQAEQDYRRFLADIWQNVKGADKRSLDQLLDKQYNRMVLGSEYKEQIVSAREDAEEVTLWEQITDTNGRDIARLNALIRAYITALLAHLTLDFMEEV